MPNRAFTATTSSLPAVSYEPRRQALVLYNNGTDTVFVSENAGSPSTDGVPVPPQVGFIVHGRAATVAFWVQANSGSQALRIYEGFGADERAAVASLAGTSAARAAWYDRGAVSLTNAYDANAAPHGATTRWSRTVASGTKLILEGLGLTVERVTAAAPATNPQITIQITPSGGAASNSFIVVTQGNAVDSRDDARFGLTLTLAPGDAIAAVTLDTSTGGTLDYHVHAKFTRYDA